MSTFRSNVLLCCPNYGGIDPDTVLSIVNATKDNNVFVRIRKPCSLLAYEFNSMWCEALNSRDTVKHFSMIHADVGAEQFWLDKLVVEQQRLGADILSVVLPIKNQYGLTSTAIYDKYNGSTQRLTLKEIHEKLPPSFSVEDLKKLEKWKDPVLCVNTGLWICDFTKPWVEQVFFEIKDRIRKMEDGTFKVYTLSEDWHFSQQCAMLGVKVFATRIVQATHMGRFEFPNFKVWGSLETDGDNIP